MKVFLSHSSKDKDFLEAVSSLLRPGTFELDSETFDAGLINSEAIITALRRSDLFCLFLSENSVRSAYVEFETLLGIEFIASGRIRKFLAICLDEVAFEQASANIKMFNVVRKSLSVESTARLIQGNLISAANINPLQAHPFIGREDELLELEKQATDHARPPSKALFISGNFGAGRKTIARKFYENQHPKAGRIFPNIDIDQFSGLEELYRKLLCTLRPTITAKELRIRVQSFKVSLLSEKRRQIAELFNSLLTADEAAFLVDTGGILTDEGSLETEINEVITHLETKPHPPVIIITPRMIPRKLRREEDDISYLALKSLTRASSDRLISRLIRDLDTTITREQMDKLISFGDGHPFNIYRMIDELSERGIEPFLASPSDFLEWKHRQSSDYLTKIILSKEDILILGLLKLLPELDFTAITDALPVDSGVASEALLRLTNLHIVESSAERFVVSPAIRIAVERDNRILLPGDLQKKAISKLAETLSIRLEEGTAPIALIDAAILASLESGNTMSGLAGAFLLPSHYVWLSKRHYDEKNYKESIRLAKEALNRADRLSSKGFVAACRYQCLSASRLGETGTFDEGIEKLASTANDNWARSNVEFLKGFNFRLKGNLPKAETSFRSAYNLSSGNVSAARELASVCLARKNLEDAESFAREAHRYATSNPYLIEFLISVLIRRHGKNVKYRSEIDEMFDELEMVGDEGGKSFFTTRKAEFEHLWGDNKKALKLIAAAVRKTPNIFEVRRLEAQIVLKDGNRAKAGQIVNNMKNLVNARHPSERRSNYRSYLETQADYLVEVGKFEEAKVIFEDQSVFTSDERNAAVRDIEITQGYSVK